MRRWINIMLLAIVFQACSQEEGLNTNVPTIRLGFENLNSSMNAGDPLSIDIKISNSSNVTCFLVWSGLLGEVLFPFKAESSFVNIAIPPFLSQQAGKVRLELVSKGIMQGQAVLNIKPGPTSGVIESYSGPKSITAGTNEKAMIIAIPKDQFGNPSDFTEVEFHFYYKSAEVEKQKSKNRHFYSYSLIENRKKAGYVSIGALCGPEAIQEEKLIINPGPASGFIISAEQQSPFADGRSQTKLVTGLIKDNSGNILPDGSHVIFYVNSGNQQFAKSETYTIGGRATGYFENPESPLSLIIKASCGPFWKSNELEIDYLPVIDSIPIQFSLQKKTLIVGPAISRTGNFLHDGFPVQLKIHGNDFYIKTQSLLEDGHCSFPLDKWINLSGTYTIFVNIGGKTKEMTLEWK